MELIYNNKPRITRLHNISLVSFSLTYGFILQSLPLSGFLDRQNYLFYAEHSLAFLVRFIADGPLATLANEPLWLLINIGLAQFFEPELVVRVVIFFSASSLAYVLTKSSPRNSIWLMLFLLMPQLLKNYITHLRQGLAMALFFTGFFSNSWLRRWLLMAASPFVHASFFFILPIVMLPVVLNRFRLAIDVRIVVLVGFAIAASLSLGVVALLVGARQAGTYEFAMASVSGLGFAFWLMIGGLFVTQGKTFLKNNQEAVGVLLFYLVSYIFIEVSARVFESGMPLVLLSGLALTQWRRWTFIGFFMLYSAIQWILRLSSATAF